MPTQYVLVDTIPRHELQALREQLRSATQALEQIQKDLVQCSFHRTLCVHEQDALKIANERLIALAGLHDDE